MDMNEATSKAIAAERSAAHLTIKELAKKANLNERTLIRLLQNERNINVIQLAQLAEVFGVYPHELIEAAERFIERAERGPVSLSVEPDSDDATARDYYARAASPTISSSRLRASATCVARMGPTRQARGFTGLSGARASRAR